MQPTPTLTPPQSPDQDDAYYRAILNDLIDRGSQLARHVQEAATTRNTPPDPDTDPGIEPDTDPTIAFDRIARAIRRTIALARHIAAGPPRPTQNHLAPRIDPRIDPRAATREKLIRGVEDAIHRKRRDTDAEPLYAESAERLEDPALEFDLEGRPVDDIIEEICRDLGVATQQRSWVWKRRTPHDIAALRARAAREPGLHLIQGGKPAPPEPPS